MADNDDGDKNLSEGHKMGAIRFPVKTTANFQIIKIKPNWGEKNVLLKLSFNIKPIIRGNFERS